MSSLEFASSMWLWSGKSKPWTQQATEDLLFQLYVEQNKRPPRGRSKEECFAQLRAVMEPFILQHISRAIKAYQSSNNQHSCAQLRETVENPIDGYHHEVYYGIMSIVLLSEGRTVKDQIKEIVQRYFQSIDDQQALAKRSVTFMRTHF